MSTEEYINAIDEMDIDTLKANFEALGALALSIEEDQASDDTEAAA